MFCEGKREKTDQPGHISALAKRAGESGSERIASFSKLKLAINGIITALRLLYHIFISQQEKPTLQLLRSSSAFSGEPRQERKDTDCSDRSCKRYPFSYKSWKQKKQAVSKHKIYKYFYKQKEKFPKNMQVWDLISQYNSVKISVHAVDKGCEVPWLPALATSSSR